MKLTKNIGKLSELLSDIRIEIEKGEIIFIDKRNQKKGYAYKLVYLVPGLKKIKLI